MLLFVPRALNVAAEDVAALPRDADRARVAVAHAVERACSTRAVATQGAVAQLPPGRGYAFLREPRVHLALHLRGFISQRLVKTKDGKRAAAIEILLGTPRVADLIKNGKVEEIKEVMEKSENIGMRTFDSALLQLYLDGKITLEEALKNADSENNLRLKISLAESKRGEGVSDEEATGGLSLTPKLEDN